MANNKSFTIDHILHGHDNNKTSLVNGPTHNYLPSFLSGQQQQFQQHDPAALAAYWMGEAYYPTGSWPIPAAAIWLQQQQQQQQHHSSNMPVDLSSSTQRQAIAQHPSLFNNSNWGPATAAAAMTGCWTTNGSPAELLAYSHHGLPSVAMGSPFFLSQHSEAAIRIAAARRHLPVLAQHQPRKGGQIRFTHRQSHHLEETFNTTRYLTPGQRRALASRLALTERQVKTWFQNRRAKWRRTRKGDKITNGDSTKPKNESTVHFEDDEEDEIDEDDIESTSDDETTKVEL